MGTRLCGEWNSLYREPAWINHVIQAWKDNGLPPNIPFFMTEGNDLGEGNPGTVKSGLWLADYVGSFMTAGGSGTYYFHYIASGGGRGGGGGFLPIDENNKVTNYTPQYLAAQVITREWVQPIDAIHKLYRATSDVKDKNGNILVTAYPVERPDGQWPVMLINKDADSDRAVKVAFTDSNGRSRSFSGPAEYQWHPDANRADPDGPPSKSTASSSGPEHVIHAPQSVDRGPSRSSQLVWSRPPPRTCV